MKVFNRMLGIAILLHLTGGCNSSNSNLKINTPLEDARIVYAIKKLKVGNNALISELDIHIDTDSLLNSEAYTIETIGNNITISGGDATGAMYGLLSLKEQLEQGAKDINMTESPRFPFRAVKFNLPWSSYRNGEALNMHHETCRDTLFWESFLDMMAENKLNKLTLWNLHPFSYMVKLEKYPEACSLSDKELESWKVFWHTLFRMAKERGIETYLINWNIFVSQEFAKAHGVADYVLEKRHFTKQGDTSGIIKDLMRESVRAVIDEYPNLTGLGITLGEAMGGMTADEREEWLLESYIDGMRKASRKVKFIHRVPLSADKGSGGSTSLHVEKMTRRTLDTLSCQEGPINIELKFNWSHAFSTPHLAKVHGGKLNDTYWNPLPENYKLAWMMRNEDFFVLRWGQPNFIKEHIKQNGHSYVNGYFVGSETYIPAKDYITSLPNASYNYAFERQWMFYKLWGQLLYNPSTPDQYFTKAFEQRFPQHGKALFEAQTGVSRVPLIIASYWNATWDYTLYSEGMIAKLPDKQAIGLLSLKQLIDKKPMEPAYLGIKEYVSLGNPTPAGQITPIQLADSIDYFSTLALNKVEAIGTQNNPDLLYEVSDIQTWAQLGMYFADKLQAGVAYQRYLESNDLENLKTAVTQLEKATAHWKQVVKITTPIYDPMPLQHYEYNENALFHWSVVQAEVEQELKTLKKELDDVKN